MLGEISTDSQDIMTSCLPSSPSKPQGKAALEAVKALHLRFRRESLFVTFIVQFSLKFQSVPVFSFLLPGSSLGPIQSPVERYLHCSLYEWYCLKSTRRDRRTPLVHCAFSSTGFGVRSRGDWWASSRVERCRAYRTIL